MIYEINGKKVDLGLALPLTLGDYEDVEAKGISQKDLVDLSFKHVRILVEHVLQKANKDVTTDDVRNLTLNQMKDLYKKINDLNGNEKPDFPT